MKKKSSPYKINLLKVLDRAISDSKIKDALRATLKESPFKTLYGQRVVDEIVNRTREKNVDKNNKSLGNYSKSYSKSFDFEVYKAGQKKVDLTLTGEMLESLDAKNSQYTIEINVDDDNRGKAQGHISGRYGKFGKSQPRDFLGLPPKEEDRLFLESIKDYRDISKITLTELSI